MIHTVFWLTGAITWGLIALAGAMFLVADLHDRSVMRRTRNGWRTEWHRITINVAYAKCP